MRLCGTADIRFASSSCAFHMIISELLAGHEHSNVNCSIMSVKLNVVQTTSSISSMGLIIDCDQGLSKMENYSWFFWKNLYGRSGWVQ